MSSLRLPRTFWTTARAGVASRRSSSPGCPRASPTCSSASGGWFPPRRCWLATRSRTTCERSSCTTPTWSTPPCCISTRVAAASSIRSGASRSTSLGGPSRDRPTGTTARRTRAPPSSSRCSRWRAAARSAATWGGGTTGRPGSCATSSLREARGRRWWTGRARSIATRQAARRRWPLCATTTWSRVPSTSARAALRTRFARRPTRRASRRACRSCGRTWRSSRHTSRSACARASASSVGTWATRTSRAS
mmetsp:Transcript_11453/g.48007  ORF Transcript_11453/g.48007 Transcript_11453/m.48007 type:complete len:250 (-) Transcript_11453:377-1126(-)